MRSMTSLRQGGREVDPALQGLANGGEQFLAGRLFEQEAGGTFAHGDSRQVRVVVHRQHDDLAVDAFGFQPGQYVEAAQPRHGEVRDDHVGAKPLGCLDEQVAVAHRADDVEVVFPEQPGQAFDDDGVVVGEEDGVSAHRSTRDYTPAARLRPRSSASLFTSAFAGIRTRTHVPFFDSAVMLTVPPASLTRSAMLTSPRPLPRSSELATSNPLPSSAIVSSAWSPVQSSRTSARLAPACAMTLRSASCAIRYRQSATSGAMDAKSPSALQLDTVPCERSTSAQ